MKQRIRMIGIIRKNGDFLLIKKNQGRALETPSWQLPTGKMRTGEQPEESLARSIYDDLGLQVKSMKLIDAVTFIGLEGSSQLGNLYIVYEIEINEEDKINLNDKYSAYKFVKVSELPGLKVDEASSSVIEIEKSRKWAKGEEDKIAVGDESPQGNDSRSTINSARVFTDGASRGNPGPSGIGYYIVGENGEELARGGKFIGFATSRVAEYYALRAGCEKAIELGLKKVRFVSDNLMLVNQMNGIYQIKNRDLIPMYTEVQELLKNFDAYSFTHKKREFNTEADGEANIAIDTHFGKKKRGYLNY